MWPHHVDADAPLPYAPGDRAAPHPAGGDAWGLASELCQRSAVFVHKILHGAKPADLPIERVDKFPLVVNLQTAQTLGLTLPSTFLFLADEVIR